MPDDEELGAVVERAGIVWIAKLVPKSLVDCRYVRQFLIDFHVATHLVHEFITFVLVLYHLLVFAFYHFWRINYKFN